MHRPRRIVNMATILTAVLLLAVESGTEAQTSSQGRALPNVRIGTDTSAFRGRDTPGLAVNPSDPRHLVEVEVNVGRGRCDYHVSRDGGATFPVSGVLTAQARPGEPPYPPPPPGGSEPLCDVSNASASMDGSVAFGTGQNVYVPFATRRSTAEGFSVVVARSSDGGNTFQPGVVAMAPAPGSANPTFTRPELAVERRVGMPDRIYVAAGTGTFSGGPVRLAVSEDGGLTFTRPAGFPRPQPPPPAPPGPPIVGDISGEDTPDSPSNPVVGPDGALYVAFRTVSGPCPDAPTVRACGQVKVTKSTDGGQTFTKTTAAEVRGYGPDISGAVFGADTVPRIAVDPRPSPAGGALYITYMQGPTGSREGNPPRAQSVSGGGVRAQDHFIHPNVDVLFVRSTDGGVTFTPPLRINDDPVGTNAPGEGPAQRQPRVTVAPTTGRVDVAWQDRRHGYRSPTNSHFGGQREARFGDTYYAFSTNGGTSFSSNRRISDKSQNLDIGMDYRAGVYWWFAPAMVSLGDNVIIAWQDSREGSRDNDNEDIYLGRLQLDAAGPTPVQTVPESDNPTLSLRLSQFAYQAGPEAVLQSTFTTADISRPVIVNQSDAAGALSGAVLSRAFLGPLLLSGAANLPAAVKAEVARISGTQADPQGAVVIGDEAALAAGVVNDLVAAGVPSDKILRLGGPTPADTAAAVARSVPNRSNEAVIVNPNTPEATTVAAFASFFRLPVLFVDRDSIPLATSEALRSLAITKTLVIGGEGAVSAAVQAQLATDGRSPTRRGGPDAQTTSEAVATEGARRRAQPNMPANIVYLASQERPMDAALLGASVARVGGTMLVVPNADTAAAQSSLQRLGFSQSVDRLIVVRGTGPASGEQGAAAAPGQAGGLAAAAGATTDANPFDASGGAGARSGSRSGLATTGIALAILAALAVLAILVGRALMRRRRREADSLEVPV
jgi:hypothetical protein